MLYSQALHVVAHVYCEAKMGDNLSFFYMSGLDFHTFKFINSFMNKKSNQMVKFLVVTL